MSGASRLSLRRQSIHPASSAALADPTGSARGASPASLIGRSSCSSGLGSGEPQLREWLRLCHEVPYPPQPLDETAVRQTPFGFLGPEVHEGLCPSPNSESRNSLAPSEPVMLTTIPSGPPPTASLKNEQHRRS